jgi:hypothetical protein
MPQAFLHPKNEPLYSQKDDKGGIVVKRGVFSALD